MSDELRDELFEAFQGMHPYRTQIDDFVDAVLPIVERKLVNAWGEGYESGVNDLANSPTPSGKSIDPECNPYRTAVTS